MYFWAVDEIRPTGDNPWNSVSAGRWNRFFTSQLNSHRSNDALKYLDHLIVLTQQLDRSRQAGGTGPALEFHWRVDGKDYVIKCIRGEVIMATAVVVQKLLAEEESPKSWTLAARLILWVSLPQLKMWLTHTVGPHLPPVCTENMCRKLLALALIRLQIAALHRWEKTENIGKNNLGARLAAWAYKTTRGLESSLPHTVGLQQEFEGLIWMFTLNSDPAKRQRLIADAKSRFESLRHWDRVRQAGEIEVTLQLPASDVTAAELSGHVAPLCAAAGLKDLVVPYEPAGLKALAALLWES